VICWYWMTSKVNAPTSWRKIPPQARRRICICRLRHQEDSLHSSRLLPICSPNKFAIRTGRMAYIPKAPSGDAAQPQDGSRTTRIVRPSTLKTFGKTQRLRKSVPAQTSLPAATCANQVAYECSSSSPNPLLMHNHPTTPNDVGM
jgi:hypothetical protein